MLTPEQDEVVRECLEKKSGGLSLPMGFGKTLISLTVSQALSPTEPIIVVMSKTLVTSWENEIRKFFPSLEYIVLHGERIRDVENWILPPTTRLVLTTSEFLSKAYRKHNLESHFVYREPNDYVGYTNKYFPPSYPLLSPDAVTSGPGTVYTRTWGCLVVDEAHGFCNILVDKCRCIASLSSSHRWLLSGTMYSEPKPENLLGYYVLLNHADNPGDVMSMAFRMRSSTFPGVAPTLVHRDKSPEIDTTFVVCKHVIQTPLSPEEAIVYRMIRDILRTVHDEMENIETHERRRKYAAYLLAMITYLRQILIAPIIVLSSVALDLCRVDNDNIGELSKMIMDQLTGAGLLEWLKSEDALYSTRCRSFIRTVRDSPSRKIVVFSGFRTALRLTMDLAKRDLTFHQLFELKSELNLKAKHKVLRDFESCDQGILFMTYRMGAEGINLQCASAVILLDTLWNSSSSAQAIARVARRGQTADKVHVYSLVSDTALEQAMFQKQMAKTDIAYELLSGPVETRYHTMRVKDVLHLVLCNENAELCSQVV